LGEIKRWIYFRMSLCKIGLIGGLMVVGYGLFHKDAYTEKKQFSDTF